MSYVHGVGSQPLRFTTVGKVLESAVAKYGNRDAVVSVQQKKVLTYRAVLEQADSFAAGLLKVGLKKGDRVGIWAPNVAEWVVVNMACARGGFIMVALNPNFELPEVKYCMETVGMSAIVCPHHGKYHNYYDILRKISESEALEVFPTIILLSEHKMEGVYNYAEVLGLSNNASIVKETQKLVDPDDPYCILFSSGTTGRPKPVVLSHFQAVNSAMAVGKGNELNLKHHKICVQVPFFHVFGTTITIAASVCFGSTIVIPSLYYSPFDSLKTLMSERCSVIYGTPTMYVDLIQQQSKENYPLEVDVAVTGGAICTKSLCRNMGHVLGVKKIKSVYGLTETNGAVFQTSLDDDDGAEETLGKLHPHLEAKVVDQNNAIVPVGSPGELCIRGYSVMLGYWGDPEKTKDVVEDGWFRTGDIFVLEENGHGKIVGRIKDIINRGGENIHPKEIEDLLSEHPSIHQVQVIGLPHDRLGEEVCACVILKEGAALTIKDVSEYLRGKVAFQKIPSQIRVVHEFPRNASGKIQKSLLVQKFSVGKGVIA